MSSLAPKGGSNEIRDITANLPKMVHVLISLTTDSERIVLKFFDVKVFNPDKPTSPAFYLLLSP